LQLPPTFIQSLQYAPGFNQANFIAAHVHPLPITSIRLNTSKLTLVNNCFEINNKIINFNLTQQLQNAGSGKTMNEIFNTIPWCANGLYLTERPSFTIDPLLHAGAYYVQEASSMFLAHVLPQCIDISRPLVVLDACAAPGGKSTLLQSILHKQSTLVSNEVIKTRVTILAENITKSGAENVIVTNNDPKDFKRLPNFFDIVVIDAPCSGSGLFKKDAKAIEEWSEQNVQLCSQRQQRIIADILPALKEDGILIYSTCSYSVQEDEAIADWLLQHEAMESIKINMEPSWGIVESIAPISHAYGYRFYPDKVKGEGFFIAAFKKKSAVQAVPAIPKNKIESASKNEMAVIENYLQDSSQYFFIKQHEEIIAIPIHNKNYLATIQAHLYIKRAGVKLGQIIRTNLLPDHQLALSGIELKNMVNIEVDQATALQYLRRQDVIIETNHKGWALITHNYLPLGWIKVLPNRINNYYPKEWRIINK
jgi:NOL1/NOP2/sun family putative RNA methylase